MGCAWSRGRASRRVRETLATVGLATAGLLAVAVPLGLLAAVFLSAYVPKLGLSFWPAFPRWCMACSPSGS